MPHQPHIRTAIVPAPLAPSSTLLTPWTIGVGGDLDAAGGGAVCSFLGVTRPETHPEHGPLLELVYEAARPLAERLLESLAVDIATRHGLQALTIRHAVDAVRIGGISVEIIAIAAHRDAAFSACREAIDRTKSEVPIWKRERWRDGSSWSSQATSLTSCGALSAASSGERVG